MSSDSGVANWMASRQICPWDRVRGVPVLVTGQIHLWWVALHAAPGVLDGFRDILSAPERARADRFRFDRHRDAYILGRGALRSLLAGYTGITADRIVFEYGAYGKPSLPAGAGNTRVDFNYSDAGGYALYAFTSAVEIGVDLEDLNRQVEFDRIVRRKFTGAEAAAIASLPHAGRKLAFLACWTRKEGYGKARGWGIRYPLDSVELCLDCTSDRLVLEAEDVGCAQQWIIRQIYPSSHFVGTLVYPGAMEASQNPDISYLKSSPAEMLRF